MTLVILQHPIVIVSFLLCAIAVILAGKLAKHGPVMALLAGVSGVFTVIAALVCGVPMTEILGALLVLLLLGCLSCGREDSI